MAELTDERLAELERRAREIVELPCATSDEVEESAFAAGTLGLIATIRAQRAEIERLRGREDDGEAIDEAWLRSVGFVAKRHSLVVAAPDQARFGTELRIADIDGVLCAAIAQAEQQGATIEQASAAYEDVTVAIETATRGDVRRLAAALGITLTDPR